MPGGLFRAYMHLRSRRTCLSSIGPNYYWFRPLARWSNIYRFAFPFLRRGNREMACRVSFFNSRQPCSAAIIANGLASCALESVYTCQQMKNVQYYANCAFNNLNAGESCFPFHFAYCSAYFHVSHFILHFK